VKIETEQYLYYITNEIKLFKKLFKNEVTAETKSLTKRDA
jgi:hypothetical protein